VGSDQYSASVSSIPASSLAELDEVIGRANATMDANYAEAMRILDEYHLALHCPENLDPFSTRYIEWVKTVHAQISRIDQYDVAQCELDPNVDPELPLGKFFPFSSRDLRFIGSYLMGVGFILRHLDLPPESRIIEYGVGWGHVSAALARAGYDVHSVDVEPKFLKLARRQAQAYGADVKPFEGEFGVDPFHGECLADGVVFFEAFHHALEHRTVLAKVRSLLRPGGKLLLCGEPIDPAFPIPWGIRTDGHALWAIRSFRWMELGFNESYFTRLMLKSGFSVEKIVEPGLGLLGLLYRCTRHGSEFHLGKALLPSDEANTWAPGSEVNCRFAQVASRLTLDESPEWRSITVHAMNHLPVPIKVSFYSGIGRVELCFAAGERLEVALPLMQTHRELHIGSEVRIPRDLGLSDDNRVLGIAIERITYREY
jgi:2-polyprenyl-3-methyl-5-hydroxy-6-metoxy-1,4-benzoquinol methylase